MDVSHDLQVPVGDRKSTQIDHILIAPNAVFLIETKNISGSFRSSKDNPNQWIGKGKSGKTYHLNSPVNQARYHERSFINWISKTCSTHHLDVHSVIVMTADNVDYRNVHPDQQIPVIKSKQLLTFVKDRNNESWGRNKRVSDEITSQICSASHQERGKSVNKHQKAIMQLQ